jgi:hypothetical protein
MSIHVSKICNGYQDFLSPDSSFKDHLFKVTGTEVPLCYPDFNKPVLFHPYTNASDHQLGAVTMQDENPEPFIRESSIQLKSGIQPLRENKSFYQLLKPARNTKISYWVTPS